MISIILVSRNDENKEKYLNDFIKKEQILPYLIFRVKPIKEEIGIDQIREIKKELITYNKDKRLFIIYSFETASIEAQNALLKTLEERTVRCQFILLVSNIHHTLPTIQSRCKIIQLSKDDGSIVSQEIIHCINTMKLSNNHEFLIERIVSGITRPEAINFIDQLLIYFKKHYDEIPQTFPLIVKKSLEIRNLIQNNNINPQLAIDNLLIFINKVYSIKT